MNFNKLSAAILKIERDADFFECEQLKASIASKLVLRQEQYLLASEIDAIIQWKLDSQYYRSKQQRQINDDYVVVPITTAVFSVQSGNLEYQTELKIKLLCSLKGIAIPLASAVLAITDPKQFAVLDSVLWQGLYKVEKNAFTTNDYLRFLTDMRKLAHKVGLEVQETEFRLWKYFTDSK